MITYDDFTKLIDVMTELLAQKNTDIAELVQEVETLERKLALYEQKDLFEVVGTSNIGDQVLKVYEKFVPDFVTDEEIAAANSIAPKFDMSD